MPKCKECKGTGEVEFTKERGGPRCNNCDGTGVVNQLIVQRYIAAVLDHPSVRMEGPSKHAMRRAGDIVRWMEDQGFFR